jgi:hypothetical protein
MATIGAFTLSISAHLQTNRLEPFTLIKQEIAGYEYRGDKHCPQCIADMARVVLANWATATGVLSDSPEWFSLDAETMLTAWANAEDVDRDNADQEDFPVPFSYAQANTADSHARIDGDPLPRCECGDDFCGGF